MLLGFALLGGLGMAILIGLRLLGLLRPFSVPTSAMAPAVSAGDHFLVEGFTFRVRPPRRGDIAVFKPDGIESHLTGKFYFKRIAGEPGERLRISDGKLYINGTNVVLRNEAGEISYPLVPGASWLLHQDEVTIPGGHYYVLGDNATNSYDSRYFGFVPASNILGRVSHCYWPLHRVGPVR